MKRASLNDMTGGWFVGNFQPNFFQTSDCEVAVKYYKKGDHEPMHVHKEAIEITLIAEGHVKMAGEELKKGDMILLEKNEATDFQVLEDTTTVVFKSPSVAGDKYLVD